MDYKERIINRLTYTGAHYIKNNTGGSSVEDMEAKQAEELKISNKHMRAYIKKAKYKDIKKIYLRLQEYEDIGFTPAGVDYMDSITEDWSNAQGNTSY